MKLKHNLFVLFILVTISLPAQWSPLNGPYGGRVLRFEKQGGYLFAGLQGEGVFRSQDNGMTWTGVNNGLMNFDIRSLSSNGTTLYAATSGGLFATGNAGGHWSTVVIGSNGGIELYSVAAAGNVILVTTPTTILRSADAGAHWDTVVMENYSYLYAVIRDPEVFVGTSSNSVLYSADRGAHFTQYDGLPFVFATNFTFDGQKMYIVAEGMDNWHPAVFYAQDPGGPWTRLASTVDMNPFSILPDNGKLFLSCSQSNSMPGAGGVYVSQDQGSHWNLLGLKDYSIYPLTKAGNNLVAGAYPGGVHVSADNGTTWTDGNNGLALLGVRSVTWHQDMLYTMTTEGVVVTYDNGSHWQHILPSNPFYDGPIVSQGLSLIAGNGDNIAYSEDNGMSWTTKFHTGYTVNCLQPSGASMFAGTEGAGIFASHDHGNTWSSANNGINGQYIRAFTTNGTTVFAGTTEGVFATTDNGTSWTNITGSLPHIYVRALAANSHYLFAGVLNNLAFPGELFIFRLPLNGGNWEVCNIGAYQPRSDVSFTVTGERVMAGMAGSPQVIFSDNDGITWSPMNKGLPPGYSVRNLGLSPTDLYATTLLGSSTSSGGLWKRSLNGLVPFTTTPDTVFMESSQGSVRIMEITSETPWNMESTLPPWLSADPVSGQGSGSITFTTKQLNPYPVPRFADLDIVSFGIIRHVVVVQHEKLNPVEEHETAGISVSPNPTGGPFIFHSAGVTGKLTVTNVMGQTFFQCQVEGRDTRLDLAGFRPGVYFLILEHRTGKTLRRIVLQ